MKPSIHVSAGRKNGDLEVARDAGGVSATDQFGAGMSPATGVRKAFLIAGAGFLRDRSGSITVIMLLMVMGALVSTGIAIDILRHEARRVDLQNALDRAVLDAASLKTTEAASSIIDRYLDGIKYVEAIDATVVKTSLNGRSRVQATAAYPMGSMFMYFFGISEINVSASSIATQASTDIEISLVLDISGTMRWSNRLPSLQVAANAFIDDVTENGSATSTTISLIPYAGGVNPGPTMFARLGGERFHNDSSCIELRASDYISSRLPDHGRYEQVPHFHKYPFNATWMDWGWCPSDSTAITYLSSDANLLKSFIDGIRLHDGTGTYEGMKWGLALLNPNSRAALDSLVFTGEIELTHADRPLEWREPGAEKFIILMTDGMITPQYRPLDPKHPDLGHRELMRSIPYKQSLRRRTGEERFFDLCDQAKELGVIVFTIAFEAPEAAAVQMRRCASSESHFFKADDASIALAFRSISSLIENVKLVP